MGLCGGHERWRAAGVNQHARCLLSADAGNPGRDLEHRGAARKCSQEFLVRGWDDRTGREARQGSHGGSHRGGFGRTLLGSWERWPGLGLAHAKAVGHWLGDALGGAHQFRASVLPASADRVSGSCRPAPDTIAVTRGLIQKCPEAGREQGPCSEMLGGTEGLGGAPGASAPGITYSKPRAEHWAPSKSFHSLGQPLGAEPHVHAL